MKVNRLSAGILAGLTAAVSTATLVSAGWIGQGPVRGRAIVETFLLFGWGGLWLCDRFGLVREPFRAPALLERYAPRDRSRLP